MGGYELTRLAAERRDAFRYLVLIDPVIMEPALYRGQAALPEQGRIAANVEQGWWIGDFEKGFRVRLICEAQDMLPGLTSPFNAAVDGFGSIKIEEQVGAVADHAARGEAPGSENSLG